MRPDARIVEGITSGGEDAEVVAVLEALRERFEGIRRHEVAKAMSRARAASQEARLEIETLSVAILRTVFDHCATMLRESCRKGQGAICARGLSELFGLAPP